jgi:hypothetical protein
VIQFFSIKGSSGGGGGGGETTWGSITGNLPDQTDLWSELSNKVNISEVSVTPSPNKVLRADSNGRITVQWLNRGSTNQILGVSGDGLSMEYKTIQGTSNQVNISYSDGAITLSTPQNIDTGASPTFSGLTLSGLTANRVLFASSGGVISQNNDLYWDNTNNRFAIGTATPSEKLHVVGNALITGTGTFQTSPLTIGNIVLSHSGLTNSRTFTFPDVSDTLVSLTANQTLTNKTIASGSIDGGTL